MTAQCRNTLGLKFRLGTSIFHVLSTFEINISSYKRNTRVGFFQKFHAATSVRNTAFQSTGRLQSACLDPRLIFAGSQSLPNENAPARVNRGGRSPPRDEGLWRTCVPLVAYPNSATVACLAMASQNSPLKRVENALYNGLDKQTQDQPCDASAIREYEERKGQA